MGVVANLIVRIGADVAELDKVFTGLEAGAARVQKKYEALGSALQGIGSKMTAGLTVPILGFGAVAAKTFVDFENAMKGVEAAIIPTGAELDKLKAAALEWGAKTKFSATDSAVALGELGKAGFTAEQSIAALPSVLQLATVSGMGLADAATLTADSLKQFGLDVSDAARVNDVLTAAAQASTVDVHQLGESLKYAGPIAAGFGLSFEKTNAALAAFGNVGIKADMAGTALKSVLGDIVSPSKAMSDVLAKLGIDTLASADGTANLADAIDTLRGAGATAADVFSAFGDRAGPGMVALVSQSSGPLRELEAAMAAAGGAAERAANVQMSGLGGALEQMKGSIETAGIAIGAVLAPALTAGANAIAKLTEFVTTKVVPAFAAMPAPVQIVIGALLALAAAIGPIVYVVGTLISAWGAVAGLFASGSAGAGVLSGALAILGGPITLVVAGVAALVVGLRWLTGSWEGVLRVFSLGLLDFGRVSAMWDLLKAGAAALMTGLQYLGDLVGGALLSAWTGFREILAAVADSGFGRLVAAVASFIATAAGWAVITSATVQWHALKGALDLVGQAFGFLWGLLKPIATFIGAVLGQAIGVLWEGFVRLATVIGGQVVAGFRTVVDWLDKLAGKAADVINWLAKTIPGFDQVAATAQAAGAKVAAFGGVVFASGTQAEAAAAGTGALEVSVGKVAATAGAAVPPLAKLAGGASKAGTAAADAARKLKDLTDELSGANTIARATDYMTALAALARDGFTPAAEGATKVREALEDAADVFLSTGRKVPPEMTALWISLLPPPKVESDIRAFVALFKSSLQKIPPYLRDFDRTVTGTLTNIHWNVLGDGLVAYFKSAPLKKAVEDWGTAFKTQVGGILTNVFTGQTGFRDGLAQMFGSVQGYASDVMQEFGRTLSTQFSNAMKDGGTFDMGALFSGDQKGKGALAGAAVGATVGLAFGQAFGKVAGAAAGALAGAATGAMIGGWTGAAVGAAVGAVSGWIAGMMKESEQRRAMGEARNELQATFGSIEKLRAAANAAGVDFDRMWNTTDPKEFNTWLQLLRTGLASSAEAVKALAESFDFATERGALLSRIDLTNMAQMTGRRGQPETPGASDAAGAFLEAQQSAALKGIDTFLTNATIKTQAGATAIAASLAGVYITMLEAGVAPTAAFAAMEGTIAKLQAQLDKTGFSGTAAFTPLADLARLAADAIAGPVFDAMAGLADGLTSTANLGLLNQESFKGFAEELLQSYNGLESTGKGGVVAMQGMHGALQKVWELSQDFGYELSAEQQTLIDVAKAGGVIGDQFRPATDRMANAIDKLVERLDRFLLSMGSIDETTRAVTGRITDAFGNVVIPPIAVPFEYRYPDNPPPGYDPGNNPRDPRSQTGGGASAPPAPPAFAAGGIVRKPTIALIGEAGPEAVVPLSGAGFNTKDEAAIYLDGDVITRCVLRRQGRVLKSYGAVR